MFPRLSPAPVIALLGDGSSLYAIQGLWTAAQLNLPITFIIVNNGRYEALLQFGRHFGLERTVGTTLAYIDFCGLALSQGCKAVRADDADAVDDALRAALGAKEPTLVEVAVESRPKGSPIKSTAPEASRSVKLRELEIALEQERRGMRPFSNSSEIVEEKGNYMRSLWLKSLVPALALATLPMLPAVSQAGIEVGVSISVAPPILPVYVQPPLPAVGYMWTPGYWAYGEDGYFWVPGTWVLPPQPGLLWTPGYWGWGGGIYSWHGGYWGPHIGFYGGVNYGFGYTGVGFQGGYWRGGGFFYNRAVMNVGGVHVTNVYNHTVINVNNHVAFNGGPGGLGARPTPHEMMAEHDHHFEATSMQRDHEHGAAGNPQLRSSFNHGHPGIAATPRPG